MSRSLDPDLDAVVRPLGAPLFGLLAEHLVLLQIKLADENLAVEVAPVEVGDAAQVLAHEAEFVLAALTVVLRHPMPQGGAAAFIGALLARLEKGQASGGATWQ